MRYGKSQLTKHRKSNEQCAILYWAEQNTRKQFPIEDCLQTSATERDLANRIRYHCGNPGNILRNAERGGGVDRRTHYGFGIPSGDIKMFRNKMPIDRATMTWNFLQCTYQRYRLYWNQVYGHIGASHCYPSRQPGERWNIPYREQYENRRQKYKNDLPKRPLTASKF